ncbi:7-deoxyloganetic acid glucosyltransferase [Thalictrum thalictroides]|uniref:Glycosyltransferase n=1 Tax=Thalictrum thalictroides TaxID=46969 RepID=A0A7J6V7R2_THATH|nr:7-deoxyloganetic acid glucosyltransferase [Thalictrum thalictroides]
MEIEQKPVAHVLIFPFPAQGHVNSMLMLAELLCFSGLHVTFLNTEHYHQRLLRFTDAQTRFASFSKFRFETISDGLPVDHPRSASYAEDLITGIESVQPVFRELMISNHLKLDNRPPVTCTIIDGLIAFFMDVSKELCIPSVSFQTASACYLWACFCYRNLIETGEHPFADNDMDNLITGVPGMESFLRRRDLPSFYRIKELNDPYLTQTINSTQASATIINTFEDLEGPILSQMRLHFSKIYTIGPLHAHLSSRRTNSFAPSDSSNSLWEVDRSCMTWLDSQPLKSVVYISFGSSALMTHKEMIEIWHGLVNSRKRFLWVIRPDSIEDDDKKCQIPEELTEGTKDKGYMVEWCPQEQVLVHPAVGGFVTHSGWNSTLESIIAGLPMVCWPLMGDQQINSRYVSEVWKIGLDMKDICNRSMVEKMVNDLMHNRRDELARSIDEISQMAKKSVSEGGTSWCNMEVLIEDIKSMNLKV